MMVRGILLTVAALVAGLARPVTPPKALPFTAALSLPQEMNFTLQGKITKRDGNKLTVNTEGNIIFHVSYDDKTAITRADGSAGSPEDLQVGETIHVDGDLQESGEIIAHKIEILKEAEKR
ncbi:MAG: DUF5666 domain-containing protein [Acidobacteriia bacterium]|nr:DUF5666 domain-containing protein [Terriglobia bacterium]